MSVVPAAGLHLQPASPSLPARLPEACVPLQGRPDRLGLVRPGSVWFGMAHRHNDLHSAAAALGSITSPFNSDRFGIDQRQISIRRVFLTFQSNLPHSTVQIFFSRVLLLLCSTLLLLLLLRLLLPSLLSLHFTN